MGSTTLYYACDVHGSDRCFRKFLNAAKLYRANTLVMGGDILGKAIRVLQEVRPGVYVTEMHERQVTLTTEAEAQEFEKGARDQGLYPYRCSRGDAQGLRETGQIGPLFERLMRERLEEWVALAGERLAGTGVRCCLLGGNKQPPSLLVGVAGGARPWTPQGEIV